MNLKHTTFLAITISLLIHLISGSGLLLYSKSHPILDTKPIEITLLTDPKKNEIIATKEVKEDDPLKLKQIVEQDKINDEIDEKAKFLSSHNQRVLQETVSKNHGQFKNLHSSSKNLNTQAAQQKAPQIQAQPQARSPSLQDLLLNSDLYDNQQKVKAIKQQYTQEKNQQASENSEASQTQDYLKDEKEGNETLLSTREFVYFSYYQRIREQLNQHWESQIKQKVLNIFRSGRRIASKEDIITKVLITLNAQGTLIKVQVVNESGIRDLDDAAIEAFRAAAPFPNPPRGIVDSDGNIKIRWDFVIEA
jgi:protein TonB